jgi:putative nucleotidyltransferase with HDIG domain
MEAAVNDAFNTQIETILLNKIANNTLALPAMPMVAVKVINIVKDPNFSIKKAVALLETDPTLAARLIQVANSAAYATHAGAKVTLESMVIRLGQDKLKNLMVDTSARQVMQSKDPRIAAACKGIFEHSLAVALMARDVAALSGNSAEMDTAYMCGLLHDVGKPVVAAMLLDAERSVIMEHHRQWVGSDIWLKALESTHRKVGVALAEAWKLPDEVCQGIRDCQEYDSSNRQCATNYVRFANALAKREGICVGAVDVDDANALIMIGRSLLNVGDEIVDKLTKGLRERVSQQLA